jgi:predicted esterase
MIVVVALLLQVTLVEAVQGALREEDKARRQEFIAQLKKTDFATVEKWVRTSIGNEWKSAGNTELRLGKSDLDGEEFPWALHVPKDYEPSKAWPLLVTLHGTGGNPATWIQTWLRCAPARDKFVIIAPGSDRHTWSARQGHSYVLSAMRITMDLLHIDPNRVYIDGMSMGGGGAFRLASHHPDRWAAIAPRCNVPDVRQKRDKSFITMLADNYRAVPIYWVVGAKDAKISIELARAAKSDLEAAKGELVYREFPDGGHDWGLEKDEVVLEWLEKHARNPYPEEIVFRIDENVFSRAFWIEVTKRTDAPPIIMVHLDQQGKESERRTELRPPAVVRAKRKGNAIDVTTEEVRELRVWLDDAMVDLDKPVTITVNGKKLHDGAVKRSVDVLIDEMRRRHDTGMTFSAFVDVKVK